MLQQIAAKREALDKCGKLGGERRASAARHLFFDLASPVMRRPSQRITLTRRWRRRKGSPRRRCALVRCASARAPTGFHILRRPEPGLPVRYSFFHFVSLLCGQGCQNALFELHPDCHVKGGSLFCGFTGRRRKNHANKATRQKRRVAFFNRLLKLILSNLSRELLSGSIHKSQHPLPIEVCIHMNTDLYRQGVLRLAVKLLKSCNEPVPQSYPQLFMGAGSIK